MSDCTGIEHIKSAAKRHRCDWCWEHIKAGEPYARWRWFGDNDPRSVKVHEECLMAINACDVNDIADGWSPGDNPRGCNCGGCSQCERCGAISTIRYMANGGAPWLSRLAQSPTVANHPV